MKKDKNYLMVTRSAFCPKCWQKDRPQKKDKFIVFGTDHQEFKSKVAHQDGLKGYTPHLYIIGFPYQKDENGLIYVTKTCLMHECGIYIGSLKDNGRFEIEFIDVTEQYLPEISIDALISKWRNTGYEII